MTDRMFPDGEMLRQQEEARQQYPLNDNSDIRVVKVEDIAESETKGRAESILRTLTKRFQAIPRPLEERVHAIADLECLKKLADFALDCKSFGEFAMAVSREMTKLKLTIDRIFFYDETFRQQEDAYQQYLHDYATDVRCAFEEGFAEGRVVGRAKTILRILTRRFRVIPKSLEEQILALTDLECLEKLADFAFDCKSLDEFAIALK